MLWWVLGIIALGLVILLLAVMALGRRARPLQRAARRVQLRAEQSQQLRAKIATLQENVESLQASSVTLQERLESRQHDRRR